MMMEKKTLYGALETKLATTDTDTGTMSGYGAVFGNVDSYGDIIAPGAFAETLQESRNSGALPLMLLNHDLYSLPIGVWDSMVEDSVGLKVAGHFIDNICGQDAYKTAKAGAINGLSIGFIVEDFQVIGANRVLTKVRLIEVSLVTLPANDLARVNTVKSQDTDMHSDEDRLAELIIEAKALIQKIEAKSDVQTKNADQDCDDGIDCDDDCQCSDGECQCDDADDTADDEETKYDEAAMSALSEIRSLLMRSFQ